MRDTRKVPCYFCGDLVKIGEIGAYRKVSGWAQVREQGGATHWLSCQRLRLGRMRLVLTEKNKLKAVGSSKRRLFFKWKI